MLLCFVVCKCAVSPTGDKLYNINRYQHKLLTLARDGTVLATYRDLLHFPSANIHVTPAGQLLVGDGSCIIQLHSEGNMKLATLVTGKEMYIMRGSVSVCYNSTTSSILVAGQSNSILVFKVQ
ncbi:hypothetical protein DPMN_150342 [Dreissena polymorpha]|uniref:Uncharacterized protein n=1 Tax=Dreissena polymorpha TaxID=45954 RepID=A0A9D4FF90_DREPO|nr:hypothetical protein DPMN_150342 [Dreissena polymorpha]